MMLKVSAAVLVLAGAALAGNGNSCRPCHNNNFAKGADNTCFRLMGEHSGDTSENKCANNNNEKVTDLEELKEAAFLLAAEDVWVGTKNDDDACVNFAGGEFGTDDCGEKKNIICKNRKECVPHYTYRYDGQFWEIEVFPRAGEKTFAEVKAFCSNLGGYLPALKSTSAQQVAVSALCDHPDYQNEDLGEAQFWIPAEEVAEAIALDFPNTEIKRFVDPQYTDVFLTNANADGYAPTLTMKSNGGKSDLRFVPTDTKLYPVCMFQCSKHAGSRKK